MSDLQTSESMGDDILEMIVCLRDGKGAAEQLKATRMYPEEAKNVALDIGTDRPTRVPVVVTKLGELALQHPVKPA